MAAGYVLDDDYNRAGPVKFAGVPGTWSKGVPVAVDDVPGGVDEKAMDALLKDTGAPIRKLKGGVKPEAKDDAKDDAEGGK